ncbi:MAG: CarD family transcriptional regulator, partial [Candidatus Omnitrophica bacterium]|nr:CarD family transcriptional regulator [Candidatus Omnitrophota bacterium]
MFKSLKIYTQGTLDLGNVSNALIDLGYKRAETVQEEGDFARRGNILDIFPFAFELPIRIELDNDRIAAIKTFNPQSGQPLWDHKMAIILPVKKARHFKAATFSEEVPLDNFLDLDIGDYVVHNQHGIGRFLGLEKIKAGDNAKDHLVIEYERQEKLYVPIESMHLVQKYVAFAARRPKLYRLGSKEWQRIKDRVRKGIQKMAWELLSLQAMRLSVPGFKFSTDTQWQQEFEATFTYQETPGQVKAMQEVKLDMESSRPMDRLLCGDVGYGKTEVALRAAFKAATNNKQVAFLVPTTILAEQHYENFAGRLSNFPVNVAALSRFKSKGEQQKIIHGLAQGTLDIVIGTHRLLSDDVAFKDLGLVIIDEEQRFGVR